MDLQITGRTVMGQVDSSEIGAMFNFVDWNGFVGTGTACLCTESCESIFA